MMLVLIILHILVPILIFFYLYCGAVIGIREAAGMLRAYIDICKIASPQPTLIKNTRNILFFLTYVLKEFIGWPYVVWKLYQCNKTKK